MIILFLSFISKFKQKYKTIGFTLLLLCSVNFAKADAEYIPELKRFFDCTVVVDGNFVDASDNFFTIRINYVLRDDSLGLMPGDYLRIHKKGIGDCGFQMDVSKISRAYYYLDKVPNSWKVYHNQSMSIKKIDNDSMYIALPKKVLALRGDEYRKMMQEVAATYIWNKSYQHADLKISSEAYIKIRQENPVIAQIDKNRRNLNVIELSSSPIQLTYAPSEPREPVPPKEKTLQYCQFLDSMAYYKTKRGDSLMKYLDTQIIVPEYAKEMEIQGKIFIEFVVETNGDLSNFQVRRGLQKDLDKLAVEVLDNMPYWKAATHRGQAERCKMIIPVRIKYD